MEAERKGDDDAELFDNLARLSVRLERLDEAADAARRLSRKPGWEARGFLLLGDILALLDDPTGSVDALRTALERDPAAEGAPLPIAHYRKQIARGLLQLAKPAEAKAAIEPLRKRRGRWRRRASGMAPQSCLASVGKPQGGGGGRGACRLVPGGNTCSSRSRARFWESRAVSLAIARKRAHEQSRHARTFHHGRGLLDLPIPDRPLTDPDDPAVTHVVRRENDEIKVETRAEEEVYRLVVAYAFGTSDQYVTMIGRDEEHTYRALRLSSYHGADGVAWGRTAGDVPNLSKNVRGEPIQVRDGAVRCLYCHVTTYREFRDPAPERPGATAADRGIGCERCHGPGGNHVKAMKGNFGETAIVNPGAGGAQAIGKVCADCHVVGSAAEIKKVPDDPKHARSPGLLLTFSRCFTDSDGANELHDLPRPTP